MPAALAAQFSAFDFSARRTIVVAVSGGSDSTALLLFLKRHLKRAAPATRLVAVTVDHRLRPESGREADSVARFCASIGVPHRIVAWTEPKPGSGLQEAAREARHRLLAEAADELGTDLVATGHTRDDLVETVLMRERRGEGLGGAGIAPATLYDRRVWFVRPLLGVGREALRACLESEGVSWLDDPSNADRRFERVRVREDLAAGCHDADAVAERAAEAAVRRQELSAQAGALIASHASCVSPGLVKLSHDMLAADRAAAAVLAFRVLAASAGGASRMPDEGRAGALLARLTTTGERATLTGAVVTSRRDGIYLHREIRGSGPQPARLEPGTLWDGRYAAAQDVPTGLTVAAFGRCRPPLRSAAQTTSPPIDGGEERSQALRPAFPLPHEVGERWRAKRDGEAALDDVPRGLAAAALAAEPTLFERIRPLSREEAQAVLRPIVAPFARYLTSFDLAVAQATASLLGADPFPAPPFAGSPRMGHNRFYA